MRIASLPNIFVKRYKDEMLIVDTKLHNVFIINDSAADIVEYITAIGNVELDNVISYFENLPSADIDGNTIRTFVDDLVDNSIIANVSAPISQHLQYPSEIDITDNEELDSEFQSKLMEDNALYAALIELTYKCNLRCTHCYAIDNGNTNKELSTEQIFSLLDQLHENGVFVLTLTGGEVFLRKDIFDIIEYAHNKGFLVDIFSNATLLDEEKAKKLSSLFIRSFQVSMYSDKADVHDGITGIKGSFQRSVNSIELLKKYGILINIKYVFMQSNYKDCYGVEQLAKKLGATFQSSQYIIPHNSGNRDNLRNRVTEIDEVKNILNKTLDRMNITSFYRKRECSEMICGMGKSGISIDPFGNIYPCNLLKVKLGNFMNDKIRDIWSNSQEIVRLRNLTIADTKSCAACDKLGYCFFCPGAALSENGDMLAPYNEACFIAGIKQCIDTPKILD